MKSRRVLQIIVAVLSITLLTCLLLSAALIAVGKHLDVMPQLIGELADTFKTGLQEVASKYTIAVPAVALLAPAVLLLLAAILLLTRNKGSEAKNIVGCIFALVGAAILAAFLILFAKQLFAEQLHLIVWCASGGVLALFVVFVGCALGVRPKRIRVTAYPEADEHTEDAATETQEASEVTAESTVENETEELEEDGETDETVDTAQEGELEDYVPNIDVTIHDVVEKTYGKEGAELSPNTIEKINKVRSLYEAKAISEQEYIKLMRKYLEF